MSKSIMQDTKEVKCYLCGKTGGVMHIHHIFFGTANRKKSEHYGLKVMLCWECHEGTHGVHHDRTVDLALKKEAQMVFETMIGSRDLFRREFGKSYL